jgi:hypothetical protein
LLLQEYVDNLITSPKITINAVRRLGQQNKCKKLNHFVILTEKHREILQEGTKGPVNSVGDLDRNFLVGRDRPRVATQKKNPVATGQGSRPKKNIRSPPTTGRDPEKKSGRDRGLRSRSGRENFFSLLFSPEISHKYL